MDIIFVIAITVPFLIGVIAFMYAISISNTAPNDIEKIRRIKEYEILRYKNHKFLLVHDPDNLPIKWDGWIIHGHKHNNDMKNYPFINGEKKTINVGVELLNYKPIDLDFIISLKPDSIKRMELVDSKPEGK